MVELIITEKPNAAERIANALGDKKPTKKVIKKVPYYEITHNKKEIIVGCAVGHLFGLAETKKQGWTYPVFDVEWKPAYSLKKQSKFSKAYVDALTELTKKADTFTIATDFDLEGEVIGYNCIRFICKQKDARRMKFSTLTKDELVQSYEHALQHLEFPMIAAGETRHYMDYFWGISLSRALTLSVKAAGSFKLLSSGRVQGPALKIIVEREREIRQFVPEPFWELTLTKDKLTAEYAGGNITEKKTAENLLKKTKGKDGIVTSLKAAETAIQPPTPFDLTTLQTEAYRCFGISPKETLSIAQELYTSGLVSYPRTSSQKLPDSLGHKETIKKIAQQAEYNLLCKELLAQPKLVPREGEKSDPAHPSIYPTGEHQKLTDKAKKVYDLIVKRFLSCFAPPAKRKTITATITVNEEGFIARGVKTLDPGWQAFYAPYVPNKEVELPPLKEGQEIKKPKIQLDQKETQPPKRYTEASIIRVLEKKNLGTKSTRAAVIDALHQRNYIADKALRATTLGRATITTLEKYCPEIIDEQLTRHFEEEMEEIQQEKKKPDEILKEAQDSLTKILSVFKKSEKQIGEGLLEATRETQREESTVGVCPVCAEGQLTLRRGKFGVFIACNKYPDCKTTFSVPARALIKPTEEVCESCKNHLVLVIRAGKRPYKHCIGKSCPKKQEWIEKMQSLNGTQKQSQTS